MKVSVQRDRLPTAVEDEKQTTKDMKDKRKIRQGTLPVVLQVLVFFVSFVSFVVNAYVLRICNRGFSSRQLERSTFDSVAFRYIPANTHPDHDTIASFRKRFLLSTDTNRAIAAFS